MKKKRNLILYCPLKLGTLTFKSFFIFGNIISGPCFFYKVDCLQILLYAQILKQGRYKNTLKHAMSHRFGLLNIHDNVMPILNTFETSINF